MNEKTVNALNEILGKLIDDPALVKTYQGLWHTKLKEVTDNFFSSLGLKDYNNLFLTIGSQPKFTDLIYRYNMFDYKYDDNVHYFMWNVFRSYAKFVLYNEIIDSIISKKTDTLSKKIKDFFFLLKDQYKEGFIIGLLKIYNYQYLNDCETAINEELESPGLYGFPRMNRVGMFDYFLNNKIRQINDHLSRTRNKYASTLDTLKIKKIELIIYQQIQKRKRLDKSRIPGSIKYLEEMYFLIEEIDRELFSYKPPANEELIINIIDKIELFLSSEVEPNLGFFSIIQPGYPIFLKEDLVHIRNTIRVNGAVKAVWESKMRYYLNQGYYKFSLSYTFLPYTNEKTEYAFIAKQFDLSVEEFDQLYWKFEQENIVLSDHEGYILFSGQKITNQIIKTFLEQTSFDLKKAIDVSQLGISLAEYYDLQKRLLNLNLSDEQKTILYSKQPGSNTLIREILNNPSIDNDYIIKKIFDLNPNTAKRFITVNQINHQVGLAPTLTLAVQVTLSLDPIEVLKSFIKKIFTLDFLSFLLDVTPFVGSVKGVIEGVIGIDIITGRDLAGWERVLSIFISTPFRQIGEVTKIAKIAKKTGGEAAKQMAGLIIILSLRLKKPPMHVVKIIDSISSVNRSVINAAIDEIRIIKKTKGGQVILSAKQGAARDEILKVTNQIASTPPSVKHVSPPGNVQTPGTHKPSSPGGNPPNTGTPDLARGVTATKKTLKRHPPPSDPVIQHSRNPELGIKVNKNTMESLENARESQFVATGTPLVENRKTVSVSQKTLTSEVKIRTNTISGWTEIPERRIQVSPERVRDRSIKIGHILRPPKNPALDQVKRRGFVGRYFASHAEKKQIVARPNTPVGVSNLMCSDCIEFFKKEAIHQKKTQVVSDPEVTRLFEPDGSIIEFWKNGTIAKASADGGSYSVLP